MRKFLTLALVLATVIAFAPHLAATAQSTPAATEAAMAPLAKVDLVMWSQEGADAMKGFGIDQLFSDWAAKYAPGSTLKVVNKDTEALRTEFQAAALAGSGGPDFMWTVADHAGPFTSAGLIQPVDDVADTSLFIPSIVNITKIDGKTYGVPIYAGNHIMLYYNKSMVATPPATFDDLVKVSKDLQTKYASVDKFQPFAYNQQESFWAFPFAHGFGATEFKDDGKTPALDTDGWVKAYQFLYDLKYTDKIEANECDYNCMDGGFKAGTIAMILNGDWALGGDTGYIKTLGDNLGIAPWPTVTGGGQPSPFIAGKYYMIPNTTKGDKLAVVKAFIKYMTTSDDVVVNYTVANGKLPALLTALKNDKVAKDVVLSQTTKALLTGVAQPVQPEMRCDFDAVTTEVRAIVNNTVKPADAATAAQKSAADCIAKLQ